MSRQAEALRLADVLDSVVGGALCNRAAAELRRQHAEIERLRIERNALRSLDDSLLTEFNALRAECDALRYLLDRAADMLHECGLRDEIYAALKEAK